MTDTELTIVLTSVPMVLVSIWLAWKSARNSGLYAVPFLFVAFTFLTTNLLPLHVIVFHDFSVLKFDVPFEEFGRGAVINTVFLFCWLVGFLVVFGRLGSGASRAKPFVCAPCTDPIESVAAWAVLLVAAGSYAYILIATPHYGWSQAAYAGEVEVRNLGKLSILMAFGKFLPAVLAVLLILDERSARSRWKRYALWVGVLATAVSGGVFRMKRGPIVEPLLVVGLAMAFRGHVGRFLRLSVVGLVLIVVLSPVLNKVRAQMEPGTFGAVEETAQQDLSATRQSDSPLRRISAGFVANASGGISAGILADVADRTGFAGLGPYTAVPESVVPTVILRKKWYPGSADGTFQTEPTAIAGRIMATRGTTVHVTGGGVAYWQFAWPGVILTGVLVGALWAGIFVAAAKRRSALLWIVALALLQYGNRLNISLDMFLYHLLKSLLVLSPILFAVWALKAKRWSHVSAG